MKSIRNFEFISLDLTDILNPKDVWIDIYAPDREFYIEGELKEGHIRDNQVIESDKICLRYNWDLKDFVDVEIYGNGRCAWYRLSIKQFNKIRYYIQEIH